MRPCPLPSPASGEGRFLLSTSRGARPPAHPASRLPRRLPGFFCWRRGELGVRDRSASGHCGEHQLGYRPKQGSSRSGSPWLPPRFPRPRVGAVTHHVPTATPSLGPLPPGARRVHSYLPPPIAPMPKRAILARDPSPPPGLQRGGGSWETPPGRLELPPLPAQYSTGPGSPRRPRDLRGRETEAREGVELPEPQNWSVRAASNPEVPLRWSAGLSPCPPSGKLSPSLRLWSPSPC